MPSRSSVDYTPSRISTEDRSAASPYEIVSRTAVPSQPGDDEAVLLSQGWVGTGTAEEEYAAADVPAAKETVVVTIR